MKPNSRRMPGRHRPRPLHEKDPFYARLAQPMIAWLEYLRQEPANRYSPERLLHLAETMQQGAGAGTKYASGMAYAEAGLLKEQADSAQPLFDKASELVRQAFYLADDDITAKLSYVQRLVCMPLYALAHDEPRLTDSELETVLGNVTTSLDSLADTINEAYHIDHNNELRATLAGAATEISILRALQRPDLVRSGYLALPAFPWEDRSIPRNQIFRTRNIKTSGNSVSPIQENRNYDIGIIKIEHPTEIIPLQIKTKNMLGLYHSSITIVYGDKLADLVCKEVGISYQPFNKLMSCPSPEEREKRYKIVGDYLIDSVLKVS